jgi:hypothetical protein
LEKIVKSLANFVVLLGESCSRSALKAEWEQLSLGKRKQI